MATMAEVPVSISGPAADRIFELELWPHLRVMLEHTRQATPGLRSIGVSLDDGSGPGEGILLLIAEVEEFDSDAPGMANESAEWRWDRWASETFPPDVLRHVCMMAIPAGEAAPNGR